MTLESLRGARFCCSWSGGKDSTLALYRARIAGGRPARLLTMMTERGDRSRSHGLPLAVLQAQANAIGIELRTCSASWADYETGLVALLKDAKRDGVAHLVFGDIDIERHRDWEEAVCRAAGVTAHLPLWRQDRWAILEEWWALGFEALLVAVKEGVVSRKFLGQRLDASAVREMEQAGVDACGENGEFHTLVTSGPIFHHVLPIVLGAQVKRGGYWFQDVLLGPSSFSENPDRSLGEKGPRALTREYLLSRGSCCGNGCLNCPYGA